MTGGGEVITGPWRATRLWNDIIRNFHSGMPLKRHRRNVRTVDNCFSGTEAIDWLHKHLQGNPNFGVDVNKEQTVQLLRKFLRAGVIESAEGDQGEDFVSGQLYRLVEDAAENLRTPGKKSPAVAKVDKRKVLASVGNTPSKSTSSSNKGHSGSEQWESKSEPGGFQQRPKKRIGGSKYTTQMKEDLNRSYFQSLPPNSLITLDNDNTWRDAFLKLLESSLSEIHVRGLQINVSHLIYNMTKVSAKGIVQLSSPTQQQQQDSRHRQHQDDLPPWVLSAMKCLANWPKPMRMINGQDSTLPNYPAFITDVFNVVKDYFLGLGSPLVPYDLFDLFVSAHIKAEAVDARMRLPPVRHHNYRWVNRQHTVKTSTPTLNGEQQRQPNFFVMSESTASEDYLLLPTKERMARIRNTLEILPGPSSSSVSPTTSASLEASTSIGSFGFVEEQRPLALNAGMSTTAIMRNFLPPNSCFETAFMNEDPVTRIVPQKECDTLHLMRHRSLSRSSCYTPIHCGWDTRSIATQTSQEEEEAAAVTRRQPRWKRASRQRKSIAVMEFSETDRGITNFAYQQELPQRQQLNGDLHMRHDFSSVGNLLDVRPEAEGSKLVSDNVILSKTVRKEKKKQRIKRERANSVDRFNNRRVVNGDNPSPGSSSSCATLAGGRRDDRYYHTSRYNNLTVKTPIHPAVGYDMHYVRAEPYRQQEDEDERLVAAEGVCSAVDSFKLLGLLLPPASRRKLQLLLKFMKRVSGNGQLDLMRSANSVETAKSNLSLVLDTFTEAILKPRGLSRYDEELCRKMTKFFVFNYDAIWTPPENLRREVEEKVYQSLVSKRLEAGEDPYPITFCQRVSTKTYDQEKATGVHVAMQDLLAHILTSVKLNVKEKRKKLKSFKEAYPDIWKAKFPTEDDEPEFMSRKNAAGNLSATMARLSSLSKLRHAMRL